MTYQRKRASGSSHTRYRPRHAAAGAPIPSFFALPGRHEPLKYLGGPFRDGDRSRRLALKIDSAFDRHEGDNSAVLRRERLDVPSAESIGLSERVLCGLIRE